MSENKVTEGVLLTNITFKVEGGKDGKESISKTIKSGTKVSAKDLPTGQFEKLFERGRIKPFPTGEKKKILKPEVKPE